LSFPSSGSPSSLPISRFQKFNNLNNSEPLNSISNDLTFKGSSLNKVSKVTVTHAVSQFEKEFGKSAANHLNTKIKDAASHKASGLKLNSDGTLTFAKKSFGRQILDVLLFPILKLPLDIANSSLKLLKKIPGLKKSKFIDNLLAKKPLKDRREFLKDTSYVASIEHYFEMVGNGKKAFKDAHKSFNPLLPNYSTAAERSITRVVTGVIPAFFLANDAYNLSMYMKNNKDVAAEDKKRRFNQEVVRVGLTAVTTFGILSLFAKKSNASEAVTTMLMSGAAFVSEFAGRLIAGTPVLPVGEKAAKYYASKRADDVDDKHDDDKDKKVGDSFRGFEGKKPPVEYQKPPEKGALTFKNVLRVAGALIVFGFGLEKLKGLGSSEKAILGVVPKDLKIVKKIQKYSEKFGEKYEGLFTKEFTVKREDFKAMNDKLRKNGFDEIANRYEDMVKDQKGPELKIGKVKEKAKHVIIDQVLAFPIKFIWKNIIMLPYKITKNLLEGYKGLVDKHVLKLPEKVKVKTPEEIKEGEMKTLQQSIKYLEKTAKQTKGDDKEFAHKINKSILSGLDNVTKSNYSNAGLASTVRTATSTVTSAFLIADNYNQVMIDSNGKNKDLAEQKAKERTIQRAVRIAYGAFLISMVNDIFRTTYNGSMLGAQMVNVGNTLITETMERKSVGLPLGESTRENIIKEEKENLKATGIKGGYFRLMAKLTGKKSLSESAAKKSQEEKKHTQAA
jgi:hypothetical protein